MNRRTHILVAGPATLVLTFALAACGGGNEQAARRLAGRP